MPPDHWEIWLDMQISPIIAKWLGEYSGYIVKSSYSLKLNAISDKDIYYGTKANGNIILISKAIDFPALITRLGSPPKLIKINIGNCQNQVLWTFLKPNILKAIDLLINTNIDIIELD